MQKDMIFFTADENYDGIKFTSTSANTVANWAKEYYQTLEIALEKMKFYSKSVNLIGQAESSIIFNGMDNEELLEIPKAIKQIAECKSLIAWLREAIKARESLNKEVLRLTISDYCKYKGIEEPKVPNDSDYPVLTEDDYWASKSIKERNAYYELETKAAVLGKYIHNEGVFSKAREDMKEKANEPHTIIGSGRDATIYNYSVTVAPSEVDSLFFEMQQKHREYQASLNALKFECQKAIETSEMQANTAYSEAMNNYRTVIGVIQADTIKWKKERQTELGKLKIILPDSLKDIYEKIASLGKKK